MTSPFKLNNPSYQRFDGGDPSHPLQGNIRSSHTHDEGDDESAPPGYHNLDFEETPNEGGVMIHVVDTNTETRMNPIKDLDSFCLRAYQYHQQHGFLSIILNENFGLIQFVFIIFLVLTVTYGVDYTKLFENTPDGHRIALSEVFFPISEWFINFNAITWICLLLAFLYWMFRAFRVVYRIFQYWEIKYFYNYVLKIDDNDLDNLTWSEVQNRIREVQRIHQLCIHKPDLTELDIYHRILRFQNYLIAMINKNLLPIKLDIPFVGKDTVFFTRFLRYNLEFLLFWGPWSPFENSWHLREDYKKIAKRHELAASLSRHILWVGVANLIFCPLILLWQILHLFFNHAEIIKREPGTLGTYRWSFYARFYLRHFNELDHEIDARLNRAYRPASKYMRSFVSPILTSIAKHIAFFCGSLLALIIVLTLYDEDVLLGVEHVLTIATVLSVVLAICRAMIPDENMVRCPETLLKAVLAHVQYFPDTWHGQAHTQRVRTEFSQLFQYQAIYLTELLLSPLVTPYILIFKLRNRALDIVDFYRNFTVAVVGVGDVCSFALMDVKKHGHPDWRIASAGDPITTNQYTQAEDGKTELSLIHFTITNPRWKMPENAETFVETLKRNAKRDLTAPLPSYINEEVGAHIIDNPMYQSIHSVSSLGGGYQSLMQGIFNNTMLSNYRDGNNDLMENSVRGAQNPNIASTAAGSLPGGGSSNGIVFRGGGVTRAEGPLFSERGLLYSLHHNGGTLPSMGASMFGTHAPSGLVDHINDNPFQEFTAADMSLSTMYLHELHNRQIRRRGGGVQPDVTQRSLWQRPHQHDDTANILSRTNFTTSELPRGSTTTAVGVEASVPSSSTQQSAVTATPSTAAAENTPLLTKQTQQNR